MYHVASVVMSMTMKLEHEVGKWGGVPGNKLGWEVGKVVRRDGRIVPIG